MSGRIIHTPESPHSCFGYPDRPIVHFGNPGVAYWEEAPTPKPKKKKKPKPKEPKTYYPGRDDAQTR